MHRQLFLDHFNAAYEAKAQWKAWKTPQLGIYAIALTYP